MRIETIKYTCDYCEKEMNSYEYEKSPQLNLSISLPNPKGGCGEFNSINMNICEQCCKTIGLVNDKEFHDYTYSHGKLKNFIQAKSKILIDFIASKK